MESRNKEPKWQWVLVLVVLSGLFFVGWKIFSDTEGVTELSSLVAEKEKENKKLQETIRNYRVRADSLSSIVADMRTEWEARKNVIEKEIKKKYNEKRDRIKYMPIDDNIDFLTEWLSEIDSSRERYDCRLDNCPDEGFESGESEPR